MHEERESEVAQLGQTLCNPMDCSLPGSSIHGIFQARVLEWGAIAVWGTWVQFVGQEDFLEKGMATHSSILAWRIPWTEQPVFQ